MENYLNLGRCIVEKLPKMDGATSSIKLGRKGIDSLSQKDKDTGDVLREATDGLENPSLEVVQKAENNYSVACFRIRNGKDIVEQGAYSCSKGKNGDIEKVHVEKDGFITTISKEGNAKPKVNIVDKEDLGIDIAKADVQKVKPHSLRVIEFVKNYGKTITGMNPNNLWIYKELMALTDEELDELTKMSDIAKAHNIKIPFSGDAEYVEMPLTLEDGRQYNSMIYTTANPYIKGLRLNVLLENHIPNRRYDSWHDFYIEESNAFHGAHYDLESYRTKEIDLPEYETPLLMRIKARLREALSIQDCWTRRDAEDFLWKYNNNFRWFTNKTGLTRSPLKPAIL